MVKGIEMKVRMIIIGGFLGAGKTTLITKLAKELKMSGVNVGIIMNDQADSLVDTQYAEALGLTSGEVAGGCFCCQFPVFLNKAEELIDTSKSQMLIAEPVGSCTDLLATVVAPLQVLYSDMFEVAPLTIMVDAIRVLDEGFDRHSVGGYLRAHQLEEAELVVLSKADLVSLEDMQRAVEMVRKINPEAEIVIHSSVNGQGFADVVEAVTSNVVSTRRPKDIDYDLYAQAEAELGWYNGTMVLDFGQGIDSYDLGKKILEGFSARYPKGNIAHAKIMLSSESNALKMSSVRGMVSIDAANGSRLSEGKGKLTINARVVSNPELLRNNIRTMLKEVLGVDVLSFESEDSFAPSPPKPFHRMVD